MCVCVFCVILKINVKMNSPVIFLSFRVFKLLSSSLLLYSKCFSWCVLQPSSGISYQTWEPTQNFKWHPLFNPWGAAYSDSINHNWVQVLSIPVLILACSQDWTCNFQKKVNKKHLKKAGRPIGWNIGNITIKMKTIVQKPLMIKII